MVHTYKSCGVYIAVDTDSGAIHEVDELVFDIIQRYHCTPKVVLMRELSKKFGRQAVIEAMQDVKELINDGQLFSSHDYHTAMIDRTQVPVKAMCMHVAHDCNLRCAYCFASEGDFCGDRMLMDIQTAKAGLDFLVMHSQDRTNLEVDFFGGEPLMNFEVVKETVAYGRALEKEHGKHFRFTLTTNGLALTPDIMDFLNQEMDNVVLSVDGRKQVHDAMRKTVNGGASYDLIIDRIKEFVKKRGNKSYFIRGTFTRKNLDFAKDVLALADEGFKEISIEPVVAFDDVDYALKPEHMQRICKEYENLAQIYRMRNKNKSNFRFFHFLLDMGHGPCVAKRLSGCGAGTEYIAVTPEGDIYPCHQFVGIESFCMGNVHAQTFDDMIKAKFADNHVLNKEACNACWAKFYCSGGCAANAYKMNGRLDMPYTIGCEMEKKRMECALALKALENWS